MAGEMRIIPLNYRPNGTNRRQNGRAIWYVASTDCVFTVMDLGPEKFRIRAGYHTSA